MKVYIAAKYDRRYELRAVRDELVKNGIEVTSRWLDNHEESKGQRDAALMDLADVDEARAVLFFAEPYGSLNKGGGRYFEIGYAHAKGKYIVIVKDAVEPKLETVFLALANEAWFDADRAVKSIIRRSVMESRNASN